MKKLLILLILILGTFIAEAQTDFGYTIIAQRNRWLAGLFQAFGLPTGDGPAAFQPGQHQRSGALYYDSAGIDAGMYLWNGTTWEIAGGSNLIAGEGIDISNDSVHLGGVSGVATAQMIQQRSINLNRKIFTWNNSQNAEDNGVRWYSFGSSVTKKTYAPFQFIAEDTMTQIEQPLSEDFPLHSLFARRTVYRTIAGIRTLEMFGHHIELAHNYPDSAVGHNDGTAAQQALTVKATYYGRNSGRQVYQTGTNATTSNPSHGVSALTVLSSIQSGESTGDHTLFRGYMVGISPWITSNMPLDTIMNVIYFRPASTMSGRTLRSFILHGGAISYGGEGGKVDSAYGWFDTTRWVRNVFGGNTVLGRTKVAGATGTNAFWASTDKLLVYGNTRITDSLTLGKASELGSLTGTKVLIRRDSDSAIFTASAALVAGGVTPTLQQVITSGNVYDNTGSGSGIDATNSGAGFGMQITNTGTGGGMYIQNNSTGLLGLVVNNASTTLPGIKINNNSTGVGLHIINLSGGSGLRYDDGNQAATKVLTSDASGNASWQPAVTGTTSSITKGFMTDVLTVAGVSTIIPRYYNYDEFAGAATNSIGTVFGFELATGTGANAAAAANASSISGATGFGYAEVSTGTTTTGRGALFNGYGATNQNQLGKVDNDYYYRAEFKNVIFADLSDGTETYTFTGGFFIDNTVSNGVIITYTHSVNSGAFVCQSYNAATPETTNTGVTVAADTEYDLQVELYNQIAKFYINGTLVATHTTQVPPAAGIMYAPGLRMLKSAGSVARIAYADAMGLRINHENDL